MSAYEDAQVQREWARLLGYFVALVVGLGVAAPLAYHALLDSLVSSGPMSPEEETRVNLLWTGALAAPVVSAGGGGYALLELVIRRLPARRTRRGMNDAG